MRVALISDVHGNRPALEKVLGSIDREGLDGIVCLGDVAATGPNPHEVVEMLSSRKIRSVLGNTDESLLNPSHETTEDAQLKVIRQIDLWCSEQLTDADREYLHTFKPLIEVQLGEGTNLLAFHGTPRSRYEWIPSTASEDELKVILSGGTADVMAGGHSHRQLLRRFLRSSLVNPGSVGQPFVRDERTGEVSIPPWAEYAIVSNERKALEISFRRVPLGTDEYRQSVLRSEMPHKDDLIEAWTMHMKKLLASGKIS